LKACGNLDAVESFTNDFKAGELRYKDLKDTVGDGLVALLEPFRIKKEQLMNDRAYVEQIMKEHSQKAATIAGETLGNVKNLAGMFV